MRQLPHVVLAWILCCSASAVAQAPKPKVYILFDTSGSMLQNSAGTWQPGDGSALCNNQGQNSRIFQIKKAFFEVLQGVGAKEMDFALATFPMFVNPNRKPMCPLTTSAGGCPPLNVAACLLTAGCGWNAGWGTCVSVPCSGLNQTSCNARSDCSWTGSACRGCDDDPTGTEYTCSGHYFQTDATLGEVSYPAPFTQRWGCKVSTHLPTQAAHQTGDCGTATCAWYNEFKTEVLKVPFGKTPEEMMLYFDQLEDVGPVAALSNPEVRVGNGWWTPLGKSLFYAHGYIHKEVVLPPNDYRKKCERLVVAFFTDGDETCNYDAADPFYAPKWSLAMNQKMGVVTHTIGIDAPGAGNLLQAIATNGKGTYYNVSGTTAQLKTAFLDILAKAQPPRELCNGLDDNCDGNVDEDFPLKGKPCDNGLVGACYRTGKYICKADGSGVVCDTPATTPGKEVCNGIDDDCNGIVDDVPGGCTACIPQPEICNNKDDDCNGVPDDGIPSTSCGSNVGECKSGMSKCLPGGQTICEGSKGPSVEQCDGLDNDCDGVRDGMSETCYSAATGCDPKTGICKGQCRMGQRQCTAVENPPGTWKGVWGGCTGEVGPSKEICDGIDNNCDGQIDEQAECPGGSQCINGECSRPCTSGEFVCPTGQQCKNGWCVLDKCDPTACAAQNGVCKAGECIDPCKDVTCSKLEKCIKGQCVDQSCYSKGCPQGQRCVQGQCEADTCADVTCGKGEYCLVGKCVNLCDVLACPAGQLCKVVQQGTGYVTSCVEDPCAKVSCGQGSVCKDGQCITDPCSAVGCPKGQFCIDGKCLEDLCDKARCPSGYRCAPGGLCVSAALSTRELLATGGGGLTCSVGQHTGLGLELWPLLLVLGWLWRRRRDRA